MKILHFYCAVSICFGNVLLQNTYAATDPNGADVNDFPEEVRFFAEETRKNLPKKMREFYAWPSKQELSTQQVTRGERVIRAREESIQWIRKVLKPQFVPKDVNDRLIALNRNEGCDQTRLRYKFGDYAIQIRQINNSVTILVQQIGKEPLEKTSAKVKLVSDMVERLFNFDDKIRKISCPGAYATWHGLLKGAPNSRDIKDSGRYWWEHVHWLTDGHTVFFSIPKLDVGPVIPSRATDWF